jgi:hypothetical protein
MVEEQYRVMNDELTPELASQGIHIVRRTDWTGPSAAGCIAISAKS